MKSVFRKKKKEKPTKPEDHPRAPRPSSSSPSADAPPTPPSPPSNSGGDSNEDIEDLIRYAQSGNLVRVKNALLQPQEEGGGGGVDVNGKGSKYGETALHEASYYGHRDVVRFLLRNGANVNEISGDQSQNTPLHDASFMAHADVALILLRNGANVNAQNAMGATPLHMTCRNTSDDNAVDTAGVLLEYGADKTIKDHDGCRPLDEARSKGHAKLVEALSKPSSSMLREEGSDQLFRAVVTRDVNQARRLLQKGVSLNPKGSGGNQTTVLHRASFNLDHEMVKLLLEHGADVNAKDADNRTPLHQLCLRHPWEATYASIDDDDGEGGNYSGNASENQMIILKLLVNAGANIDAKADGDTPLHLATDMKNTPVARFLLAKGTHVESCNKYGKTPLLISCENRHAEMAGMLLCDYHAKANAMDEEGMTPLHWAIVKGSHELIDLLVASGADVNRKRNNGDTALHLACFYGYGGELRDFVEHGAEVNTEDIYGWTPLQYACLAGNATAVEDLMKLGVDVHAKNKYGGTALDYARSKKHMRIASMLKSRMASETSKHHTEEAQHDQKGQKGQKSDTRKKSQTSTSPDRQNETSPGVARRDPEGQKHERETNQQGKTSDNVDLDATGDLLEAVQIDMNQRMEEIQAMIGGLSNMNTLAPHSSDLKKLVEQFDLLYAVAEEKQQSLDEQIEHRAIFSSCNHREFYCVMFQKLDCTVTACKSLASDMVQQGSHTSYRSWLSSLVKEKSIQTVMQRTQLGLLVSESIKWAADQVPFPFVKTFGTIFHALCSIKQERDKYLAVARVAAFASLGEEMGGISAILAKVSRLMIRSGRFVVRENPEYASWQKWALEMLAEPSTQSQAQGCLVAEQVLQCIMMPGEDCPIQKILDGEDMETSLDVAVASVVLRMAVKDVQAMAPFSTPEARNRVSVDEDRNFSGVHVGPQSWESGPDVMGMGQGPSSAAGVPDFDPTELMERVTDLTERVRRAEEENTNLKRHIKNADGTSGGEATVEVGGGLAQMYANEEQKYEGRLERLELAMDKAIERLEALSSDHVLAREIAEDNVRDIQDQIDAIRNGLNHRRRGIFSRNRPVNRSAVDP